MLMGNRQDNHRNGDLAGRGRDKADNSIGRENVHTALGQTRGHQGV